MKFQDIPKFERLNDIPVALYTVKQRDKTIYPLYITKMRNKPPIRLLLIEGDEQGAIICSTSWQRETRNRNFL